MKTFPPASLPRRGFLATGPALAAALATSPVLAQAQAHPTETWTATWGAAPAGPPPASSTMSFADQTLRLIVRTSIGGNRLRVRLSNEMGSTPLRVGAACVALRAGGAIAGPPARLAFGGQPTLTIPPGAPAVSDPVNLIVPPQSDLAVSLYLPGTAMASTIHSAALQTSYASAAGDFSDAPTMPVARSFGSWPFLTEVDVDGTAIAVVTLGDSLTDGQASTANANRRWPDYLARRLQTELGASTRIGVVNRGISANQLLLDYPSALLAGHDALQRFDRDVGATAGARFVIVLIGINDIVYSPSNNPVPAAQMIAGYQQLIARARLRGLGILGATIPPFEGHVYYTARREAVRAAVNDWLRTGGAFDALVDVDLILRDSALPMRLRSLYDSGDHLHPNDMGYQALANAVPISLFMQV